MHYASRLLLSLSVFLGLTYDANGFSEANAWVANCQQNSCEAVIDAGSSGTRLHVFKQAANTNEVTEVFQQKVFPGLSEVKLSQLNEYLAKLFPTTPDLSIDTYFYATAGMRLLTPLAQDAYYKKIQLWFRGQDTWQLKDIRTISGQEEGAFAWIAVNQGRDINDMQAVIEFGGASAQINMPISDDKNTLIPADDIIRLKLNGKDVNLWSKSYLGLGINEVEKVLGEHDSCYSVGYPLKNGLLAYGDAQKCIQGIEDNNALSLIQRLDEAKQVLSSMNKPVQWIALGSLYYTAIKPPFKFVQYQFSLNELKNQADSLSCHQDWLSLLTAYKDDPFLYRNCFAASYFYAYMADGMGVDGDERIGLPQQNQGMDWAFGVVLAHQNH